MSTREQILQVLEPIASNMGLDLEDVEIKSAGKNSIVQVSIDKDGGINLDEVAQISNQISEALDAKEVLGEKPYTLEVGSPGMPGVAVTVFDASLVPALLTAMTLNE